MYKWEVNNSEDHSAISLSAECLSKTDLKKLKPKIFKGIRDIALTSPNMPLITGTRGADAVFGAEPRDSGFGMLNILLEPQDYLFSHNYFMLDFKKDDMEGFFYHNSFDGNLLGDVHLRPNTELSRNLAVIASESVKRIPDDMLKKNGFQEKGFYLDRIPELPPKEHFNGDCKFYCAVVSHSLSRDEYTYAWSESYGILLSSRSSFTPKAFSNIMKTVVSSLPFGLERDEFKDKLISGLNEYGFDYLGRPTGLEEKTIEVLDPSKLPSYVTVKPGERGRPEEYRLVGFDRDKLVEVGRDTRYLKNEYIPPQPSRFKRILKAVRE